MVGVARLYARRSSGTLVDRRRRRRLGRRRRGLRRALRRGPHRHAHPRCTPPRLALTVLDAARVDGRDPDDGHGPSRVVSAHARRPCRRARRRAACIPVDGMGEIRRGDDLATLIAGHASIWPTATWSSSRRRSSPRPRVASCAIDPDDPDDRVRTHRVGVGAGPAPPRRPPHHRDRATGSSAPTPGVDLSNVDAAGRRCSPTTPTARPAASATACAPPTGARWASSSPTPSGGPGAKGSSTSPSAAPGSPPSSTCGAPPTPSVASCWPPRCAWPTRSRRRPSSSWARRSSVPVAVVRGVDPALAATGVGGRRDHPAAGRGPLPLTGRRRPCSASRPVPTAVRRVRRRSRRVYASTASTPSLELGPCLPSQVDAGPFGVEGAALDLARPGRGVDRRARRPRRARP